MKILIFYSKTGSGHLRAAQAIKEQILIQKSDTQVELVDGLDGTRLGIRIDPGYLYGLISGKLLAIYNLFYLLTNNIIGVWLLRFGIKLIWGGSLKKIIEEKKPDLIISTHHHMSPQTIDKLSFNPPFITVVTDLGYPHLVWYDKLADKIITPTKEIKDSAEFIIKDNSKVIHVDYPLKSLSIKTKSNERTNTLLVIGGGLGVGNIEQAVLELLKETDQKIVVICGNNLELFDKLKKLSEERLSVFGYVEEMGKLYGQADIVITKAGPGTIVEAATLQIPLLINSWVGIQEKDNVDFVLENKLGVYEPEVKKLPQSVDEIYKNYELYSSDKDLFEDGSRKIVEYILSEYY